MKERPILFSTEMVQAILDGRKTETRRVIKPPFTIHANGYLTRPDKWGQFNPYPCPYGKKGDSLYVRETWAEVEDMKGNNFIAFKADWEDMKDDFEAEPKWKPSIHMKKIHSRIWLRVKEIKVERVQDITVDAVFKEGVQIPVSEEGKALISVTDKYQIATYMGDTVSEWTPEEFKIAHFAKLWDSINAGRGYSFESNPWCWVVSFEVISVNGKPKTRDLL